MKLVSDVVWVGIRVIGVFLLLKGLVPLLSYFLFAAVFDSAGSASIFAIPTVNKLNGFNAVAGLSFLLLVIYSVVGAYLLFLGKSFHALLTRIPRVEAESDSLPEWN